MADRTNITFDDIAKYTGFSKTTISRYFNHPDSLTDKNRKIVADALDRLGYRENKVARILAKGQSDLIGVMLPDLYHHFYLDVLNRLLNTYQEFGYKFIVFNGNQNESVERQVIDELLAYKIAGLIVLSHTIPSIELSKLPIPVIGIEREDQYIHSISTDNRKGGYEAARLLAGHGCDVLLHVNSEAAPSSHIPSYGRIAGFLDYCREHGTAHREYFRDFPHDYDGIERDIESVLSEIERDFPTQKKGIFLSSDNYAAVLVNQLVRQYGRLPDNYLIVGFDNSSVSREAVIPISTIGQQTDVMAREAVLLLRDLVRKMRSDDAAPAIEPVHRIIEPVVYERATTQR
ncbi:MAG: LacI family DNA-binding transcriptional regulator [Chordicoccus sp.]